MDVDKTRAPLYEMLTAHASLGGHAYHVPGHKQRGLFGDEEADRAYRSLLRLDVTELADTDDLHHPQGPIAEAQRLAAACFGAEETSFLIGGSTSGNLAMIVGTCRPGDLFLVQRNVHKSIIHGLMLADAQAVMLAPQFDSLTGLAVMPSEATVEEAIHRYPHARGLILTAPNYYGMTAPLDNIVWLAHRRGIPVLIDEAHGAHLGFHPTFPESALRAGADVVVQSTHKMLSAMTMGAMLHMQGSLVDREAIKQALRMVQSSSPSFPLLASLDLARRQLHIDGAKVFESPLAAVKHVLDRLEMTPFRAIGQEGYRNDLFRYDPLKLVLFDTTGKLSGTQLQEELAARHCFAEMADDRYVVLAFGPGSSLADGETLADTLQHIAAGVHPKLEPLKPESEPIRVPELAAVPEPVTFRRDRFAVRQVRLEESVGHIAGEWIIPYPPGIPVLYPGEVITRETLMQLERWRASGARIQGAADETLATIAVQGE